VSPHAFPLSSWARGQEAADDSFLGEFLRTLRVEGRFFGAWGGWVGSGGWCIVFVCVCFLLLTVVPPPKLYI